MSKDEVVKCFNVHRVMLEEVLKSQQNISSAHMKSLLEDVFSVSLFKDDRFWYSLLLAV